MITSVLFVCLGNICRSPMAEAVFRHHVEVAGLSQQITIDSCGTGGWHKGEPPHQGTIDILRRYNISTDGLIARKLTTIDLKNFHYIIPMDQSNLVDIKDIAMTTNIIPSNLDLLLSYAKGLEIKEVPDPYYTGEFDFVYELVDEGCKGLLEHIKTLA